MIKVFKFKTGEEIVGHIEDSGDTYIISNSCIVHTLPPRGQNEAPSYSLIPYASFVYNTEIIIKKDEIVWIADPAEFLTKNYQQYAQQFLSVKI